MLHAAARHEDTQQRLFPIRVRGAQHNRTMHIQLPARHLVRQGRGHRAGGAHHVGDEQDGTRPRMAAATALTPTCAPKIHSPTVRPSAPAVIFSLRDSGPSFSSSSLRSA